MILIQIDDMITLNKIISIIFRKVTFSDISIFDGYHQSESESVEDWKSVTSHQLSCEFSSVALDNEILARYLQDGVRSNINVRIYS